jgi:hypothetical protein
MLIFLLVFECSPGKSTPAGILASLSRPATEAFTRPARNYVHPVGLLESGMSSCGMSRPVTWCRDEATIYFIRLGSESVISFANCCSKMIFKELYPQCPACLQFHCPCCQNRSAPYYLRIPFGNVFKELKHLSKNGPKFCKDTQLTIKTVLTAS